MKELRRWVKENPNTIKWVVIVGLLIIAFLNASCSQKIYDAKEESFSIDSLVLKSFVNSSLIINNSVEVTLDEKGDTVKIREKTFGVASTKSSEIKEKVKYINRTKTITITKKKKVVPFWVIGVFSVSLIINLLFIIKWIKKKGFY